MGLGPGAVRSCEMGNITSLWLASDDATIDDDDDDAASVTGFLGENAPGNAISRRGVA